MFRTVNHRSLKQLLSQRFILPIFILLLTLPACKWESRGGENYGVFAPEDAWIEGDSLPYYGSENEWSRRMFEKGAADSFYKRRGQRQMLAILDGKAGQAVKYCQRRLREDKDDPEVNYMLTLAYAGLGQLEKADRAMARALELGMPFGRFIAGPRELMLPIHDSELFQQNLATASRLVHGPMLGKNSR
jgi:tetratricopeptide (TPR) repeat protein